MTSQEALAGGRQAGSEAIYLLYDSGRRHGQDKIDITELSLIDIQEKDLNKGVIYGMLLSVLACGILIACELAFDVLWISDSMLEVLCGLSIFLVTSAGWYVFRRKLEVVLTFNSGKRMLLD